MNNGSLVNLLDNIDYQLGTNTKNNNYYEKLIKEGIPFFKEENYNNINDEIFKENGLNRDIQLQGNDSHFRPNLTSYLTEDIPISRKIDRELTPFIEKAKNEINIIIEKFKGEIQNFRKEQIDLLNLKEKNEDFNKKLENNQGENSRKFVELDERIRGAMSDIDKVFGEVRKINRECVNNKVQLDEMRYNIPNLSIMKNKLENFESGRDKSYKEIVDNLSEIFDKKIISIREENGNLDRKIENQKEMLNQLNKQILNLNVMNQETREKIDLYNNEIHKDMEIINSTIKTSSSEITTLQLAYKPLSELIKGNSNKIVDLQKTSESLMTDNEKKNAEIKEVWTNIEAIKKQILEVKGIINESVNKKSSDFYSDLNAKIAKNRKEIEEKDDKMRGKIESVNDKISEILLKMKENAIYSGLNQTNENQKKEKESQFTAFKSIQMQYNTTFKNGLDIISKEITNIKNKINQKNEVKIEDKKEENCDSNNNNFDKKLKALNEKLGEISNKKIKGILEMIEKIKKDMKTAEDNHLTLRNDVVQLNSNVETMKSDIGLWEDNVKQSIIKNTGNLREEIEKEINKMKVANIFASQMSVDQPKMVNVETARQLDDIEKGMKEIKEKNEENGGQLRSLATTSKISENRITEIIKNRIPQIYAYVDNKFKDFVEILGEDMSNPNTLSERLNKMIENNKNNPYTDNGDIILNNDSVNPSAPRVETSESYQNNQIGSDVPTYNNKNLQKYKYPSKSIPNNQSNKIYSDSNLNTNTNQNINSNVNPSNPNYISNNSSIVPENLPSGFTNTLTGQGVLVGDGLAQRPTQTAAFGEGDDDGSESVGSNSNNYGNVGKEKAERGKKEEMNRKYGEMDSCELIHQDHGLESNYVKKFLVPFKNDNVKAETEIEQRDDGKIPEDDYKNGYINNINDIFNKNSNNIHNDTSNYDRNIESKKNNIYNRDSFGNINDNIEDINDDFMDFGENKNKEISNKNNNYDYDNKIYTNSNDYRKNDVKYDNNLNESATDKLVNELLNNKNKDLKESDFFDVNDIDNNKKEFKENGGNVNGNDFDDDFDF